MSRLITRFAPMALMPLGLLHAESPPAIDWSFGLPQDRPLSGKPHELSPEREAEILLREALSLHLRDRHNEARHAFERYFDSPGRESMHSRLEYARLLAEIGDATGAASASQRAMELGDPDPEAITLHVELMQRVDRQEEALELLQRAILDHPGDPKLEFHLAEIYFSRKDYTAARIHYRQTLFHIDRAGARTQPLRSISLWKLASIYFDEQNLDQAKIYLVRYMRHNPESYFGRFVLGFHVYFAAGDYEKARRELEKLTFLSEAQARSLGIDQLQLYAALAQIYYLQNDFRTQRYMQMVMVRTRQNHLYTGMDAELRGDMQTSLRNLLPFLQSSERHFAGRVALTRALRLQDDVEARYRELISVATLALQLNQSQIGLALLDEAVHLIERNGQLAELIAPSRLHYLYSAHYEQLGMPHRAIIELRYAFESGEAEGRWLDEVPGQIEFNLIRLLGSSEVARFDEALDRAQNWILAYPEQPQGYYLRGMVYLQIREPDKALFDFSRSIDLTGGADVAARFYRAISLHLTGDDQGAESDIRKILEKHEDMADANNFLGYLLADRGVQLDEALVLIQKAVDSAPANGSYQDSLGWTYFRQGRLPEALYHLQLAALLLEESDEQSAIIHDHLGDVYLEMGESLRALASYRQALEILRLKKERSEQLSNLFLYGPQERELYESLRLKIEQLTPERDR